jgi:putative transposase
LVLDTLTMAVWQRKPKHTVTIYSNQRRQFGGDEFNIWCRDNRWSPSMGRRGICCVNAAEVFFFSNLKSEKKSKNGFTKQDL